MKLRDSWEVWRRKVSSGSGGGGSVDGYILKEFNKISDTHKNLTFAEALKASATHLLNVIKALEDDEILVPTTITVKGYGIHQVPSSNTFNNTATKVNLNTSSIDGATGYFRLWKCQLSSVNNASSLESLEYDTSNTSWTHAVYTDTSAGSQRGIDVAYQIYKKIN